MGIPPGRMCKRQEENIWIIGKLVVDEAGPGSCPVVGVLVLIIPVLLPETLSVVIFFYFISLMDYFMVL